MVTGANDKVGVFAAINRFQLFCRGRDSQISRSKLIFTMSDGKKSTTSPTAVPNSSSLFYNPLLKKSSSNANSILNYFKPVSASSSSSNIQIVVPEHKSVAAANSVKNASASENSCPNPGASVVGAKDPMSSSKKKRGRPKKAPICIEIDEMMSSAAVESSDDDFVISLVNDAIEGGDDCRISPPIPTGNLVNPAVKPYKSKSLGKKDGLVKPQTFGKHVKKDGQAAMKPPKKKSDKPSSIVDMMMGKPAANPVETVVEPPMLALLPNMGLEDFKPLRPSYSDSEISSEQLIDCLMIHQFIVRFGEDVFELKRSGHLSFALFLKFMVQRNIDTDSDVGLLNILHDLLLFVLDENAPEASLSTVETMMAMFLFDKQRNELSSTFIGSEFKCLPFQCKIDAFKILLDELMEVEEFRDYMKDAFIQITDARAEIAQLRKEELQLRADEPQLKFQAKNLETRVILCEKERDAFVAKVDKKIDSEMAPLYQQLEDDEDRRESHRKRELELKKMRDKLYAKQKPQIKEKDNYLTDLRSQCRIADSDHKKNVTRTQQITTTLIKEQEILIKRLSEDVRGNELEELGKDPWERRFYLYQPIGCILIEPLGTHTDLPKQWQCIKSKEQLASYIDIMKTSVRFLPQGTKNMLALLATERIQNIFASYDNFVVDVCLDTELTIPTVADVTAEPSLEIDSVVPVAADILADMKEIFSDCCEKIDIVWKYYVAEKIDYGTNGSIAGFRVEEQMPAIDACETVEQLKQIAITWVQHFEPRFFQFKPECLLCELLIGKDTCSPMAEKELWVKYVEQTTSRSGLATVVLHLIEHLDMYLERLKCRFGKAILVEALSKQNQPEVKAKAKPDSKKRSLRSRKLMVSYSEETTDDENAPNNVKLNAREVNDKLARRSKRLTRHQDQFSDKGSSSESETDEEDEPRKKKSTFKSRGTRRSKRIASDDEASESDDDDKDRTTRKRTRASVVPSSSESDE